MFNNNIMPDDKLARALGSKVRRDIIHILLKKEMTVYEVADELNLSEVNASKHLKKLYDLGLLNTKKDAQKRYYSIKIIEIKALIKEYDNVSEKLGGNSDD